MFYFRVNPMTGQVNTGQRADPTTHWSSRRKMVEAEKLLNTIQQAIE
jgi:hypothetical protein